MSRSIFQWAALSLILWAMLSAAVAVSAAEREVVPTPPGGGAPIPLAAPGDLDLLSPGQRLPDDRFLVAPRPGSRALRASPVGGDDILVPSTGDDFTGVSLDIATDGTLFAADAVAAGNLNIRRSTDGGTTWTVWATFTPPVAGDILTEPCLRVADGDEDRVLLAYVHASSTGRKVCFTWAPLSGTTGAFIPGMDIISSPGTTFHNPRFDTDAKSWSNWYIYLVASSGAPGSDIWFVRSIDQGTSFEAAYPIGDAGSVNDYVHPDVSYGSGGYVHVSWSLVSPTDAFDAAIRYRRASTYGGGGTSAWGVISSLTSHTDGFYDLYPRIAASTLDARIAVVHERLRSITGGYLLQRPQVEYSATGIAFSDVAVIPQGPYSVSGLEHDQIRDRWVLCGEDQFIPTLQDTGDPLNFGEAIDIGDRSYYTGSGLIDGHALALDPSRGGRAGVLWTQYWSSQPDTLRFDAEWRNDPGYPVMADGFPVDLPVAPISAPALFDLDRDGDLEILWSGSGGFVFAMHHDGTWVAGWPVNLGVSLSAGPVAVASLYPGGDPLLAVGTQDGRAYVLDEDGAIMNGWPVDMPNPGDVYVSWATLMAPYPRHLVAAGPGALRIFDYDGDYRLGWSSLGADPAGPAACGDIDGDGSNELVCSFGSLLRDFDFQSFSSRLLMVADAEPSAAVSLADVDLDGDVEIAFPLTDGTLHLLQGDGSEMSGWPYVSATGTPLSRPAIANVLGSFEPEIAVAARNFNVHLLYASGTEQYDFPVQNDGWYIYSSPILAHLEDPNSADIVLGARGSKLWAWTNGGEVVPGYPRGLQESVYEGCAFGDLDGDGFTELVVPSQDQILLFETRQTVNPYPAYSWPMEGYDAARTGCLDCPTLVPAALDDSEAVTHVSFAAPHPNPVTSGAVFSFAVPVDAVAQIEVFDLRGRRVRTVTREEVGPGRHVTAWDGRDAEGRPLASGHYLARLRVRGAGVNTMQTRKITVIR
jgi:hypothetical protein